MIQHSETEGFFFPPFKKEEKIQTNTYQLPLSDRDLCKNIKSKKETTGKVDFYTYRQHRELKSMELIQIQISLYIYKVQSHWRIFNPILQLFLCPMKYELLEHMALILTMNHILLSYSGSHRDFNFLLRRCVVLLNIDSDFQISLYLLYLLTGLASIRLAWHPQEAWYSTWGILLGGKRSKLRHAQFQSNSWHN